MFKTKARTAIFTTFGIIALAIFIFLLVSVVQGNDLSIDRLGAVWAENRTIFINNFFEIFTHMGSIYFMIAVTVFILIFDKNRHRGISVALILAIVGLLNVIVKYSVLRDRPDYGLIEETGMSFPSAHAMISMGFYGYLIYLAQGAKRGLRIFLTTSMSISIFLLGVSRVYLGVHYVSDVVAGWCLGFVTLVILIALCEFAKRRKLSCQKK